MAKSQARIGFGTTLEIALVSAPDVWTFIAETKSHTPPSFTDSTVEVTHMQSPNRKREYISGLTDSGSSSHEMNFIAGSVTDRFLLSIGGKNLVARLTFVQGMQMIYSAVREGYERDIPMDDAQTATLTLKVSGDPVLTSAAAPRNLVAPTIEGTPKVGIPLIVDEGVWAGAEGVTYQWEAAGSPVSGATLSSYVPVAADIGDVMTCVVTGANGSFSTSVETAATAGVAA